MTITFAQAMLNATNMLDPRVYETFRRNSRFLDLTPFVDAVSGGGGSTLTYSYNQLVTASGADFRAYGSNFPTSEAIRTQVSTNLKPLGGAFNLDRTLAHLGTAAYDEVATQLTQKIVSTSVRFVQAAFIGDSAVDPNSFDGLSKMLAGLGTEKTAGYTGVSADWRQATIAGSIANANTRLAEVDDWLSNIIPTSTGSGDQAIPGAIRPGTRIIAGNTKVMNVFKNIIRTAGLYTLAANAFGDPVGMYGQWELLDIGDRHDGATPIIPITGGTTDLYAVTLGTDSFHGVSVSGAPLVRTILPDFSMPGAVQSGEVELGPVAVALKTYRAAGVLRSIQVQ